MSGMYEPVALHLLPIGDGQLTPAAASEWLEERFYAYFMLSQQGESGLSPKTRTALGMLGCDVVSMVIACGRALTRGKPVELVREFADNLEGDDFQGDTRHLAEVLSVVELFEEVGNEFGEWQAVTDLARGLQERLALTTPEETPQRAEVVTLPTRAKRRRKTSARRA